MSPDGLPTTLVYDDDWLTIHGGDARTVIAELEAESVHCVVTSPPYWGLRDYGTATWAGGDEGCDHVAPAPGGHVASGLASEANGLNAATIAAKIDQRQQQYRSVCGKCGATSVDSQLGIEATPEEYVANIVAVFREVRRVLRRDGTVWLNLGDSYADRANRRSDGQSFRADRADVVPAKRNVLGGTYRLKAKDLVGSPWRVAFALQADGWYLRSDVVWSKPNPMPESITDRPTKSHEYLFLLAKSSRYYFDADAVRETDAGQDHDRRTLRGQASLEPSGGLRSPHRGIRTAEGRNGAGRNIRSVWTIATQPYPGAHFAVFPEKLVEPCILAGTSERGVCPECGAPWVRVVEWAPAEPQRENYHGEGTVPRHRGGSGRAGGYYPTSETTGWAPSCAHVALRPSPAIVLDPFAGSGTVARVANRHSRRAVLIDLNPDYLRQQMTRNRDIPLGLQVPA